MLQSPAAPKHMSPAEKDGAPSPEETPPASTPCRQCLQGPRRRASRSPRTRRRLRRSTRPHQPAPVDARVIEDEPPAEHVARMTPRPRPSRSAGPSASQSPSPQVHRARLCGALHRKPYKEESLVPTNHNRAGGQRPPKAHHTATGTPPRRPLLTRGRAARLRGRRLRGRQAHGRGQDGSSRAASRATPVEAALRAGRPVLRARDACLSRPRTACSRHARSRASAAPPVGVRLVPGAACGQA